VLYTIYVGAGPEYGKANFDSIMLKEINALKAEFKEIPFTTVADGAANNWTFLQAHVQTQIIDWWHAWQYIRAAIETIFPQEKKQKSKLRNGKRYCKKTKIVSLFY
jgi:DNA primase large subunit